LPLLIIAVPVRILAATRPPQLRVQDALRLLLERFEAFLLGFFVDFPYTIQLSRGQQGAGPLERGVEIIIPIS